MGSYLCLDAPCSLPEASILVGPQGLVAEGCCCAIVTASCPCCAADALGEVCSRLLCHTQRKHNHSGAGVGLEGGAAVPGHMVPR